MELLQTVIHEIPLCFLIDFAFLMDIFLGEELMSFEGLSKFNFSRLSMYVLLKAPQVILMNT